MRCWRWRGGAPFRERESERDGESEADERLRYEFQQVLSGAATFAESQIDGKTQVIVPSSWAIDFFRTATSEADCAERRLRGALNSTLNGQARYVVGRYGRGQRPRQGQRRRPWRQNGPRRRSWRTGTCGGGAIPKAREGGTRQGWRRPRWHDARRHGRRRRRRRGSGQACVRADDRNDAACRQLGSWRFRRGH